MRGPLAASMLAVALAAAAAHAQAPAPNAAADQALAEGRRLYDLQEWDKAIAKFKEAYALREDAAALFNIAQSYRLKGDCAQAASFYKTYKRKFPKEKNIAKVEKFISDMETCAKAGPATTGTGTGTGTSATGTTGTGTTGTGATGTGSSGTGATGTGSTTTTGTTTTGTGTTTGTTGTGTGTTGTGTGTHMTTGTGTPGNATGAGATDTGASTPGTGTGATSTGGSGATTGTTSLNATAPHVAGASGGGGLRVASYVTLGAGGAGLVIGVVFGLKARGAANEAEDLAMGDMWKPGIEDRGERAQSLSRISFIAGGALVAGGVVMYLLSRPKAEHHAVTLAPSAEGASYSLFTSCFGGNQNTNSTSIGISIAVACPRFDLILIALDSGNAMISYAALGAVANVSNASIVVPANAWREMGAIETMLARVPSAPINLTLQYSAYVTPELAYSTGIVQPSLAQGRANATAFPTALGTTAQIYLTVGFGNDQLQQLYVERLPPNTVSYARDMSTTRIPFPAANIFDAATKKLTWQTAPPEGGVTQLAPDVSYVDLSFRRNGELFEWHIIGRGEHIAPSANSASYVLPPVPPGIAAIVPTASDTITNKTVYYLRAWPSLETEIRSHIESRIVWLDVFDVQGLMAVARAASF